AVRQGDRIILRVRPTDGMDLPAELEKPWFFASDAFVQYDEPQETEITDGMLTLNLPVAASYDGAGERLVGVLRTESTWAPGNELPGLSIDVPLGSAPLGAAALTRATPDAAVPVLGGFAGTLALALV